MITGVDLSVLLSFFNVGVLVWFARLLRAETDVDARQSSDEGSPASPRTSRGSRGRDVDPGWSYSPYGNGEGLGKERHDDAVSLADL
jgi:hypothetical protein